LLFGDALFVSLRRFLKPNLRRISRLPDKLGFVGLHKAADGLNRVEGKLAYYNGSDVVRGAFLIELPARERISGTGVNITWGTGTGIAFFVFILFRIWLPVVIQLRSAIRAEYQSS